jgi:serine/threonine protein kinase
MFGQYWFGEHAPWTILALVRRGNSSILQAYHPASTCPGENEAEAPGSGSGSSLWIIKQHLLVLGDYEVQHHMWKEVVALHRFQAYRCSWCPSLFGVSLEQDTFSIAMEYIPISFAEMFPPHRRSTIELVRRALRDLLYGLATLHTAGFAHRDIKPENLRFRADGMLVIMDYDSSDAVDTPFRSAVFGTPACRDPYLPLVTDGLFLSDDTYDYRTSDMFSAGYVFLAMTISSAGEDTLSADTVVAHLLASACVMGTGMCAPPPADLFSRKIRGFLGTAGESLLRRLLCSRPSDRYTAQQSLASVFLTPLPLPTMLFT